jgi:tRNA(Ser,Leu) C12 N-acetylase TAN1
MEWNVVATLKNQAYREGVAILRNFGEVEKTAFYNLVVMQVADPAAFMAELDRLPELHPAAEEALASVITVSSSFTFQDVEEFEDKSLPAVAAFAPQLAGKAFHIRLHRRGFKGRLKTPEVEGRLCAHLIDLLQAAGTPGRITFTDPDAILALETVGTRAGLSLWTREELARHRFLKID